MTLTLVSERNDRMSGPDDPARKHVVTVVVSGLETGLCAGCAGTEGTGTDMTTRHADRFVS